MDIFIEKIVKNIDFKDYLIAAGLIFASFIILGLVFVFYPLPFIILVVFFGLCYLLYYLISSRSIEYEYIVTNGELDIDIIIAKRKRKGYSRVKVKILKSRQV